MTNQPEVPEALRLAEHYDYGDPATHGNAWKVAVCNELRRQHTRIVELETERKAVGAGGVQALSAAPANPLTISPLEEQQMFDDWCPYRGNPDPRTVWAAAIEAVNGMQLCAASPTPPAEQHTDDIAVDCFARALKAKLAAARAKGRGGWDTPECTQQRLSEMLRQHVGKGDPRDVANFCLFLWARGEAIAPQQEAQEPVGEVQHLHELNDSWLNKLPVGTKLYTAPQQKPSQDTMYLLRRLLSNQHTLTGPEFRAELEKIVGEAYQQEAQEPVVAAVFDEQLGRPMLVEGAPMLSHGQPLFTAARARLEENITHN